MQARVEKLRKSISDPIRFGLDPLLFAQTQTAFERLATLARNLREDTERYGDASLAASVRQSELQNRLTSTGANSVSVSWPSVASSTTRSCASAGWTPRPRPIRSNAEYDARAQNTDARDLNSLAQARVAALRLVTERDALTHVLTLDLDTIKKETETRATRSQNVNSYMERVVGAESDGRMDAKNPLSNCDRARAVHREDVAGSVQGAFPRTRRRHVAGRNPGASYRSR